MSFMPIPHSKKYKLDIKKIELLNSEGKEQQVKKLLTSYTEKYNKLPHPEQNNLLKYLFNYNLPIEAIKRINGEMTNSELTNSSEESILTQMRLSRILILIGCEEASLRIARKVFGQMKERETYTEPHNSALIFLLISRTFLDLNLFDEVDQCISVATSKGPVTSDSELYKKFQFHSLCSACYNRSSQKTVDLSHFEELKKQFPDKAFTDYIDVAVIFLKTDFLLENASALIQEINESEFFHRPYLKAWRNLHIPLLLFMEGKKEEAREMFQASFSHEIERDIRFMMGKEFYKELLGCNNSLLGDRVFLRCYPVSNNYSFSMGNRFMKNLPHRTPLMELETSYVSSDDDFDSWLISNGEIKKIKYAQHMASSSCIDLISGMLFHKNKKFALSPERTKSLMSIISSGSFGIHEIHTADRVYGHDIFYPESARLRIRSQVNRIEKMGIKIKKSKGIIYYNFDLNHYDIIFPRDHHFRDKISYIRKILSIVNIKNVTECLGVKPSTASLYIKQWKAEGHITTEGVNRYGDHRIIS